MHENMLQITHNTVWIMECILSTWYGWGESPGTDCTCLKFAINDCTFYYSKNTLRFHVIANLQGILVTNTSLGINSDLHNKNEDLHNKNEDLHNIILFSAMHELGTLSHHFSGNVSATFLRTLHLRSCTIVIKVSL